MPVTVQDAVDVLVDSVRAALELNELPVATLAAEAGVGLRLAIARGVRSVGGTVASLTAPTDADLATVPEAKELAMLDVAGLHWMRWLRANWTVVTGAIDVLSDNYSDLLKSLNDAIAAREAEIRAVHGLAVGGVAPAGGVAPRSGAMVDQSCWRIPPSW